MNSPRIIPRPIPTRVQPRYTNIFRILVSIDPLITRSTRAFRRGLPSLSPLEAWSQTEQNSKQAK
jgi:hypothetical protein